MINGLTNRLTAELLLDYTEQNKELDSKIVSDFITDNEKRRDKLEKSWNRYLGDVPILQKKPIGNSLLNNIIAFDYRGEIVRSGVSYFLGVPIVYSFDTTKYNDEEIILIKNAIDDFNYNNQISALDAETSEIASATGYCSRLLYVDTNGQLKTMKIPSWESYIIKDATLDEVQFGIIYYRMEDIKSNRLVWKVEVYDKTYVWEYIQNGENKFQLETEPKPHMFDGVPLIQFNNNSRLETDFFKVETQIDAIDKLFSMGMDESEEFRIATLTVFGGDFTEEDKRKMNKDSILSIPEGVDAKYMIKDLPTEWITMMVDKLEKKIYHQSATIDPNDPSYSGNAESSIAKRLKWGLVETKTIEKERAFTRALNQQYKLMCQYFNKKNIPLNPRDMKFIYSRNIVTDYQYWGQSMQLFTGQISDETKLAQLPFISDPRQELEKMRKERELYGNNIDITSLLEVSGSN